LENDVSKPARSALRLIKPDESADTVEGDEARRRRCDQVGEFAVEAGAVGVDVDHPAAEGLHGELGGVGDRITGRVGAQGGGGLSEQPDGDVSEPFPQLIGGGEAEMAELVEARGAGVAPGTEGDQQHPDRFHVAIGVFATPWARPLSAARAASMASTVSHLPWLRRACRFGRSTSITATPARHRKRARPAP
jgi:hypothetical protein